MPVRILQLVQSPQRRGAEVFARQLSEAHRRRAQDVAVLYLYEHDSEGLPLHPGDIALGADRSHVTERMLGANPQLLSRLSAQIRRFRPDIVQLNGARTVKYGSLVRRLLPRSGIRLVYRNIGEPRDWLRGGVKRQVFRALVRSVNGVVALSESSLEQLRDLYPERARYAVIPNAIDPLDLGVTCDRSEVRRNLSTPPDAPVVVAVGSLTIEKRIDLLVEAFDQVLARHPAAVLWIVGDGPLRSELEGLASRRGIAESMRFTGTRPDVANIVAAADLLALTSDTEGIPAVLLEAGYLGKPVVATAVGGIPDCIVDGVTGLLVPPGEAGGIGGALANLIENPEQRAGLGLAARQHVESSFLIDVVADRYLDFYASLLEHPNGG